MCEIDVAGEVARTRENVEAVARRERYSPPTRRSGVDVPPRGLSHRRGSHLHRAYRRRSHRASTCASIVGTGPAASARCALWPTGRSYAPSWISRVKISARSSSAGSGEGGAVVCDAQGELWREDATNAHTDRVPRLRPARDRPESARVGREDDHVAREVDEPSSPMRDDMLDDMAEQLCEACVRWVQEDERWGSI